MTFIKVADNKGSYVTEDLFTYCRKLSKKNNSVLYKLEEYLGVQLASDVKLMEIRDILLTVSADISRIPSNIVKDEENERL